MLPLLTAERVLRETDVAILGSYCSLFSKWLMAAEDVAKHGLTVMVEYKTKNGQYSRPVPNPNILTETRYFGAMLKAASKLGLSPIDRERVTVSPWPEDDDENTEEDYSADDITFDS